MATRPFLDTNILVYAITIDDGKSDPSADLVAAGGVISVQVLNEFVNTARRKFALDWSAIEEWLDLFRAALDLRPLDGETQARAVEIARDHRLNIYDATILAAAEQAGCDLLYSEDLQAGATLAGVQICNPY